MYIHEAICLSPQQTFPEPDLDIVYPPVDGIFRVREPDYSGFNQNQLRRMTKTVKLGIAASGALAAITGRPITDLSIGTGTGGNEASMKFLKQIAQYSIEQLTPGDFIQSTPNAVATQIAFTQQAHGYNMTHVHGGLSFENALLDGMLAAGSMSGRTVCVGGVDEQSDYGHRLNVLAGWHPYPEELSGGGDNQAHGKSLAGESCCLFNVSSDPSGSRIRIREVLAFESEDPGELKRQAGQAMERIRDSFGSDWSLLSGRDAHARTLGAYDSVESLVPAGVGILGFKHLCGDYPTASAFGLWTAHYRAGRSGWPSHMWRRQGSGRERGILLYNCHKAFQHGLMALELL